MLTSFEAFSLPPKAPRSGSGGSQAAASGPGPFSSSALHTIELYHDKLVERQSGGVARKIGFLREEESKYEPAATAAPTSGVLVRWAYPVDRRARLETVKVVGRKG